MTCFGMQAAGIHGPELVGLPRIAIPEGPYQRLVHDLCTLFYHLRRHLKISFKYLPVVASLGELGLEVTGTWPCPDCSLDNKGCSLETILLSRHAIVS